MEATQSIPNGTNALFFFRGMLGDFEDSVEDYEKDQFENLDMELKDIDGWPCKIESLETYSELGQKDYEYYNISIPIPYLDKEFISLTGISGYHLEPDLSDNSLHDLMSIVDDKLTPDEIQVYHRILLKVDNKTLNKLREELLHG